MTQFLEEHPGGDEVILSATGKPPTTHTFDGLQI